MAKKQNLSDLSLEAIELSADWSFGIVCAEWNTEITESLRAAAHATLIEQGVDAAQIHELCVPGAMELALGARWLLETHNPNAIICLGCVIKGETSHDQHINRAVAQGITQLSLTSNKPIIYGVLTPNNYEQAFDRAGGAHGNKGVEAAATALKMLDAKRQLKADKGPGIGFR